MFIFYQILNIVSKEELITLTYCCSREFPSLHLGSWARQPPGCAVLTPRLVVNTPPVSTNSMIPVYNIPDPWYNNMIPV